MDIARVLCYLNVDDATEDTVPGSGCTQIRFIALDPHPRLSFTRFLDRPLNFIGIHRRYPAKMIGSSSPFLTHVHPRNEGSAQPQTSDTT
jgi:hypothetical protein